MLLLLSVRTKTLSVYDYSSADFPMSGGVDKKHATPNPTRRGGGASWEAIFAAGAPSAPAAPTEQRLSRSGAPDPSKVGDYSQLLDFIDALQKYKKNTPKWKEATLILVDFISTVKAVDESKTEKGEKHWTYHFAHAMVARPLAEDGSNVSEAILSYAPGIVSARTLDGYRALIVANPSNERHALWDCIKGSLREADSFCGAFRDYVCASVRESTARRGNGIAVRLGQASAMKRALFSKFQSSCGGLAPGQACSSVAAAARYS